MIEKYEYCFANISTMKAQIIMKFYLMVNSYLVSISFYMEIRASDLQIMHAFLGARANF